jgi:alkylation response protein AidB-like acyl-CoA dehydrogenase
VDLTFSAAEEAFRTELRAWLGTHAPPDPGEHESLAAEVAFLRRWQQTLSAAGWVGIHWPRAYGGRGASVVESYLFQEEMAAARAPEIIGRIGVNLVGPTLIAHGTEEQKQRFLPPIMPAEEIWCQLFSEPDAGSDLTALRTKAERRGDGWVVNGQKVWTSYAQFARWGILLARTDPAAPKAKGISFFICDMQQPGVTVRPLRQMTGGEEFNEVFLDDVFIPRAHLVGAEHDGWRIANTTLTHERGTSPRQLVINRCCSTTCCDSRAKACTGAHLLPPTRGFASGWRSIGSRSRSRSSTTGARSRASGASSRSDPRHRSSSSSGAR